MTGLATAASRWWWGGRREPDFIAAEIVGPDAIADLAAVRFDHRRLQERAAAGIQPVVDVLALRVVLAARRRAMTTSELAATCRVSPSGVRRAVSVAVERGAVLREGRLKYRTHPAWGPSAARVVAVELKLQDWPGALDQAHAYSRWANAAWMLLARTPPAEAVAVAAAEGIGAAVLSPSGEVALLARPAPRRRPAQRWAAIWASEQLLARAMRAGFPSSHAPQSITARRAIPVGAAAASLQ
jgi:hypothetical protein